MPAQAAEMQDALWRIKHKLILPHNARGLGYGFVTNVLPTDKARDLSV
jgi:hypothetical protein